MNGHSVIILAAAAAPRENHITGRRQGGPETTAGEAAPTKTMSPRPRQTSDEEILAATARVMQRRGPAELTLAHVAKEAGVVPATLVQRFGTKRGLLLAAARTAPGGVPQQFAAARTKYRSSLKALVELFVECTGFAATPQAMANGLAYLQNDITDPEFRAITLAQFRAIREETRKLLDEAVAARELLECDTKQLARLIQQTYGGSMLDWAVYREGPLASWVRRDLEALLAPYRRNRRVMPRKKRM